MQRSGLPERSTTDHDERYRQSGRGRRPEGRPPGGMEGVSTGWLRLKARIAVQPAGGSSREDKRGLRPTRPQSVFREGRRFHRQCTLDAHESSVAGSKQELRVDQSDQHRRTGNGVEPPEPLSLAWRQPQAWHFQELALDSSNHRVVVQSALSCFMTASIDVNCRGTLPVEQAMYHGTVWTSAERTASGSRKNKGVSTIAAKGACRTRFEEC